MLFMLHYEFKYLENLNDYQYRFEREAMPRLSRQQREQAIGRLHAGQAARVIANDFNCQVQNRYILRRHLNNRFVTASETARHTVGTHQRLVG